MGTAIKHPVPDRVKPSFVIFDIRAHERTLIMNIEISDNGLFGVKVLVSDRLHTGIKVSVAVTERVTTKILGYTEQLSAYYT